MRPRRLLAGAPRTNSWARRRANAPTLLVNLLEARIGSTDTCTQRVQNRGPRPAGVPVALRVVYAVASRLVENGLLLGCPIKGCGQWVLGPWDLEWHTAAEHPGWTATDELLRPYPNSVSGSCSADRVLVTTVCDLPALVAKLSELVGGRYGRTNSNILVLCRGPARNGEPLMFPGDLRPFHGRHNRPGRSGPCWSIRPCVAAVGRLRRATAAFAGFWIKRLRGRTQKGRSGALLRSRDLQHVGGSTCPEDQIAKASPANATASRRVAGSSTASS
jgi:hypothetical protein